jgi:small conductance mechanosensitive channel
MEHLGQIFVVIQDLITRFGLNVIAAIAILLAGQWFANLMQRLARRILSRANVDPTFSSFAITLTYYVVLGLAVISALNRLGVQTASLVAVLGAGSLAVGLALQGSLSNFAAGVLILIFRPFNVGDLVESGDVWGYVDGIQILTTTIVTFDNKLVVIPNASLTQGNIVNYSVRGKLRVDMVIGVAYDSDIDQVKRVISQTLSDDPLILKDPKPTVAVLELADSSVNFAVWPWADPDNYWDVYLNTHEQIKKSLDAAGITIPFPQRDVHLFQNN